MFDVIVCISRFACVVKVNAGPETNEAMQTWTRTFKNTLAVSPEPLIFLQLPVEMSCSESCACLFNYHRNPDGRRTQHVTSDTLLAATTWLGEVQCQCWVKASVGVIGSVKGSWGTSRFTAGCVVIQIQRNIWELEHVGAHLSHSPLSSDIWARLLQHRIVVIPPLILFY